MMFMLPMKGKHIQLTRLWSTGHSKGPFIYQAIQTVCH
jgi:hypothetical protein